VSQKEPFIDIYSAEFYAEFRYDVFFGTEEGREIKWKKLTYLYQNKTERFNFK